MERDKIAAILLELLEEETGEEYTDLDDSQQLRDGLNLDSVDMMGLVLRIENHFDIEIASDDLEGIEQVGQLLSLLQAKLGEPPQSQAA